MQIEDMVCAVQTKLDIEADGRAGPQTLSAIYKRIVDRTMPVYAAFAETFDRANGRSETIIESLDRSVQP